MYQSHKKWVIGVEIGIIVLCLLVAGVNIWNDPLFQYTNSEAERGYRIYKDATYQNPGIAKDRDYEGIITGSSMTQNFDPEYFENLMGFKFRKLSYSGGNAKNCTSIIQTALRANPKVKYVVASLDSFGFMNEWTSEGNQSPEYLLNDILLDDVNYIFNKTFLFDYSLDNIRNTNRGRSAIPSYERFCWYGCVYGDKRITDLEPQSKDKQPSIEEEYYLGYTRDNLKHYWIPLIEQNPSVQFALFFPPYSILSYHSSYITGYLDSTCRVYEEVADTLLEYQNVNIYDFQAIEQLVTNLYCYKDQNHYHFRVNDFITRCLISGAYRLQREHIHDYYARFKQFVKNYDCDFYYTNPLMNTEELQSYLELLADERYTVFVSALTSEGCILDQWLVDKLNGLGMSLEVDTLSSRDFAAVLDKGTCLRDSTEMFRGSMAPIGENKRVLFGIDTVNDVKYQRMEIDGVIYSPNSNGLNFVVYDKILNRVVDSVSFALDGTYTVDRLHAWSDIPQLRQCWRDDEWMGGIENGAA